MIDEEHKRRVRYSGTHPRTFQDKYKELNPDKYVDDVEKVIGKGRTPAGMHIPICVNEIMEFLQIKPGQVGLDATLGYGGHTQKMLVQLGGSGHLFATDVDPIESAKTKTRLSMLGYNEDILTIKNINFASLDEIVPSEKFDFILADLGVSSMQIDNPERGFTFKRDGKLDLRLNPTTGITASERLRELNYMEIVHMLVENSDEPHAEVIAKAIMRTFKTGGTIGTTRELFTIIESALDFLPKYSRKDLVKKSCQRTFQALRIDVNSELEVLATFLEKLPNVLKSGGRVAVLTFHSGEDRLVKKFFKAHLADGLYSDVAREVIRPTIDECNKNPRATCTKMRWAVRT